MLRLKRNAFGLVMWKQTELENVTTEQEEVETHVQSKTRSQMHKITFYPPALLFLKRVRDDK